MRNYRAGSRFSAGISLSHYGDKTIEARPLKWKFLLADGRIAAAGETAVSIAPGERKELLRCDFALPELSGAAQKAMLCCELTETDGNVLENSWDFWIFPASGATPARECREADHLDEALLEYLESGGRVLLTGGFPLPGTETKFRMQTAGRSEGHCGIIVHDHPLWRNFPHEGFGDWQFFPLVHNAPSLDYPAQDEPEFVPLVELIPCYKLIVRRSMLSEFKVGAGRLMICTLNIGTEDPAAKFLHGELLAYLGGELSPDAPDWSPEDLRRIARAEAQGVTKAAGTDMAGEIVKP